MTVTTACQGHLVSPGHRSLDEVLYRGPCQRCNSLTHGTSECLEGLAVASENRKQEGGKATGQRITDRHQSIVASPKTGHQMCGGMLLWCSMQILPRALSVTTLSTQLSSVKRNSDYTNTTPAATTPCFSSDVTSPSPLLSL